MKTNRETAARRKISRRTGFTLVEMLVTLSLLIVIGSLAMVTFQVASSSRRQALARIEIAEKSRSALEVISQEVGSSILNTISVSPYPEGLNPGDFPPEDLTTGADDDGDGLVNEQSLAFTGLNGLRRLKGRYVGDGLDNDGDASMTAGAQIVQIGNIEMIQGHGVPKVDEEYYNGIDDDGDGMVDEDIIFPSDMLNFVVPANTSDFNYSFTTDAGERLSGTLPVYDLVEVGYALDPQQNKLRRRYITAPDMTQQPSAAQVVDGLFLVRDSGGLEPGNETEFADVSEILAFDVLGLDFRYYYYDYQVATEMSSTGDSAFAVVQRAGAVEMNSNSPSGRSMVLTFPSPGTQAGVVQVVYPYANSPYAYVESWDSHRQDVTPGWDGLSTGYSPFWNINNEPDDAVSTDKIADLVGDPNAEQLIRRAYAERRQQTDGLPRMVEMTLFVVDRNREFALPSQYKTKVYMVHR